MIYMAIANEYDAMFFLSLAAGLQSLCGLEGFGYSPRLVETILVAYAGCYQTGRFFFLGLFWTLLSFSVPTPRRSTTHTRIYPYSMTVNRFFCGFSTQDAI